LFNGLKKIFTSAVFFRSSSELPDHEKLRKVNSIYNGTNALN
jgi:hypothetical protein